MVIVNMTHDHLDAVYALETRSFPIPWSKNELRRELSNPNAIYKVALIKNKEYPNDLTLAGYAGMWHIVNEGQITNIAVDTNFRGMGIGSLLIDSLVAYAKSKQMIGLTLEVRISNTIAQKLYHKHGFKPEGIRKRYYADTGEDAIIMWKYFEV